jgi:hypothetical protein
VDLGALARPFGRELNYYVGPCRDTGVQCVKRVAVCDLEREMMQTDVAAAIERHAFLRIFDLPQRHDSISVGYEGRRIAWIFTNNLPAKAFAKETPRACEIPYSESDVIDADRQRVIFLHS